MARIRFGPCVFATSFFSSRLSFSKVHFEQQFFDRRAAESRFDRFFPAFAKPPVQRFNQAFGGAVLIFRNQLPFFDFLKQSQRGRQFVNAILRVFLFLLDSLLKVELLLNDGFLVPDFAAFAFYALFGLVKVRVFLVFAEQFRVGVRLFVLFGIRRQRCRNRGGDSEGRGFRRLPRDPAALC